MASLLYRGQLRYYIEDKVGECIIDSIPHSHTENAWKRGKNQEMWLRCYIEDVLFTIKKTELEYVSSIVFHTVIRKIFQKRRKSRNVASFLYRGRTKLENLSSIVFHTVLLKNLSNMAKIKIFYFISV